MQRRQQFVSNLVSIALIGLVVAGCGTESAGSGSGGAATSTAGTPTLALPIAGVWKSNFDAIETIGAGHWQVSSATAPTSVSAIVRYDATARWLLTRNAADASYAPGAFNRIVWHDVSATEVAYCTVDFGLASEDEAAASSKTADAADLDGKGCGGFSWTRLSRPEAVGMFESQFGGNERLDAEKMGWANTIRWDNAKRTAVSQNSADDTFSPNTFNLVRWAKGPDGAFFYCTVDYGHATAELAEASTKTADDADLEGKGCAGFPWTRLDPLPLLGVWKTNFDTIEAIDGIGWGASRLDSFRRADRVAIVQSPQDDPYTPGQFSRIRWSEPSAAGFAYCIEAYGKATAAEADADPATSDATDLDGKGCGGFPWTQMAPAQ